MRPVMSQRRIPVIVWAVLGVVSKLTIKTILLPVIFLLSIYLVLEFINRAHPFLPSSVKKIFFPESHLATSYSLFPQLLVPHRLMVAEAMNTFTSASVSDDETASVLYALPALCSGEAYISVDVPSIIFSSACMPL